MPAPFLDPVAGPCPTVDRWQRMLAGEAADADLADLRRHLDACPKCHALLDRLTEIPSLRNWAADLSPAGCETEEQRLVKRLHEFAPPPGGPLGGPTVPAAGPPAAGSRPSQSAGPGDLVGPYRLETELGRGGMGVVFRAKDTLLGRTAAVKLLPPGQVADPTARGRFLREARAAAGVRNDHIVVVYQVGEHGETMYLAMELLHGETLDGRLRRQGALPLADAVRFAREAAQGLAAAHAAGLVHRDIKPANLWIEGEPGAASAGGRLKILDFGLARPAAEAALTQAGVVVGTPAYMPPEQANGEAVDHRGDLFSLGCVLYHMVTGGPPFAGDGLRAVLKAVLLESPGRRGSYGRACRRLLAEADRPAAGQGGPGPAAVRGGGGRGVAGHRGAGRPGASRPPAPAVTQGRCGAGTGFSRIFRSSFML
ncbi:MAG: protein kinase [Gemmataceae bacterium]